MGRMKYQNEIKSLFEKNPVVSSREIKLFVKKKYRHILIGNLLKKGKIKRVIKGFYTIFEDPILAVHCFRPCYIGLQEALSIHKIWEQETATIIVTSRKVKNSSMEIFGNNVLIHRINPKYMFGFDIIKYGDFFIPVSDLEKTLIDLAYFNKISDKKIISIIKRKIDRKKFENYLSKYPAVIRKRINNAVK